jgi:hypothetical protein
MQPGSPGENYHKTTDSTAKVANGSADGMPIRSDGAELGGRVHQAKSLVTVTDVTLSTDVHVKESAVVTEVALLPQQLSAIHVPPSQVSLLIARAVQQDMQAI